MTSYDWARLMLQLLVELDGSDNVKPWATSPLPLPITPSAV
jgi:hypothetical protein